MICRCIRLQGGISDSDLYLSFLTFTLRILTLRILTFTLRDSYLANSDLDLANYDFDLNILTLPDYYLANSDLDLNILTLPEFLPCEFLLLPSDSYFDLGNSYLAEFLL